MCISQKIRPVYLSPCGRFGHELQGLEPSEFTTECSLTGIVLECIPQPSEVVYDTVGRAGAITCCNRI